jgi:putative oxidoreductase
MKAAKIKGSRGLVAGFWIFTALFCLEMIFTAYYELLVLPQAAQAFTRLGFPPAWFRVELSWAKVAGVAALLMPMVPARGIIYVFKEWAYAGFAINLISALIAHLSIGDRPQALAPSAITSVLWVLSYFFWRRLQSRLSEATDCS